MTNDKVSNRKTMPDSEEALHQLLQCNYKFVQTHKRIQARNKLTPKVKMIPRSVFQGQFSEKGILDRR